MLGRPSGGDARRPPRTQRGGARARHALRNLPVCRRWLPCVKSRSHPPHVDMSLANVRRACACRCAPRDLPQRRALGPHQQTRRLPLQRVSLWLAAARQQCARRCFQGRRNVPEGRPARQARRRCPWHRHGRRRPPQAPQAAPRRRRTDLVGAPWPLARPSLRAPLSSAPKREHCSGAVRPFRSSAPIFVSSAPENFSTASAAGEHCFVREQQCCG